MHGVLPCGSGCAFQNLPDLFGSLCLVLALCDNGYYMQNCRTVMENRAYTTEALRDLGFEVLPSLTNFVFAKTDRMSGEALYLELKRRGILVRHFGKAEITDYNRITIGTREQMEAFISTVKPNLEELS